MFTLRPKAQANGSN